MKLKQLVFSSLPRPKSKEKKKKLQEQHEQNLQENQKQRSQSESQDCRYNKRYNRPLLPRRQFSIPEERPSSLPLLDVNQNDTPKPSDPKSPVADETEKETHSSNKTDLQLNLNSKAENKQDKCACYKNLTSPESPEDFQPIARSDTRYYNLSSSSMEDSGFSSLPKTRTRIKTNPWLPSPRSTPSTTPELSPMASSSSSPIYHDRRSFDSGCQPQSDSPTDSHDDTHLDTVHESKSAIYEEIAALSIKAQNCFSNKNSDMDMTEPSEMSSEDSPLRLSLLSEVDITEVSDSTTINDNFSSGTGEKPSNKNLRLVCGREEEKSSSFEGLCDKDLGDESAMFTNGNFETQVSFEYEEAFESQLEGNRGGHHINLHDNLNSSDDYEDDDSNDDLFNDPLGSRAHDFDSEYCPSNYDSSCHEINSETETDDTICDDYYTETGLRRGGRPTPFNDVFRDYYHYADDEDDGDEEETVKVNNFDIFTLGSFNNLYYDNPDKNKCTFGIKSNGKAATRARLTLSEKVNRLRRHKHLVDEKIREAQDEEKNRLEEQMKFRKQMDMHRKQLLLKTLQELQDKLESQSERLQQTYTAVLSMQRAVISNRQEGLHRRHLVPIPDTREAPF